ncbi:MULTISPECIES: type VII secretion target [Nocardiaceae]|jgi:hypothetical protein|uniref:type VII secretion target n=1 Tax=Nocardiaceae TaxID=85025 RepID=UPI001E543110|nr:MULTISPECIES: type VII secretion target [Rhodococcus]MCC8928485.1 hypothetical protein [Rhodococcus sp. I2R]MCZ4277111.1 type VII secretion target [Rhodococcus yunnanensis]
MAEVAAASAGLQAYSSTAAEMAAEMGAAAAATTACGPAVLAPVFGVIGTEFLAAFTGAHVAHAAAIGRLSEVVASIGVAVASSAHEYEATDAQTAASLT